MIVPATTKMMKMKMAVVVVKAKNSSSNNTNECHVVGSSAQEEDHGPGLSQVQHGHIKVGVAEMEGEVATAIPCGAVSPFSDYSFFILFYWMWKIGKV